MSRRASTWRDDIEQKKTRKSKIHTTTMIMNVKESKIINDKIVCLSVCLDRIHGEVCTDRVSISGVASYRPSIQWLSTKKKNREYEFALACDQAIVISFSHFTLCGGTMMFHNYSIWWLHSCMLARIAYTYTTHGLCMCTVHTYWK